MQTMLTHVLSTCLIILATHWSIYSSAPSLQLRLESELAVDISMKIGRIMRQHNKDGIFNRDWIMPDKTRAQYRSLLFALLNDDVAENYRHIDSSRRHAILVRKIHALTEPITVSPKKTPVPKQLPLPLASFTPLDEEGGDRLRRTPSRSASSFRSHSSLARNPSFARSTSRTTNMLLPVLIEDTTESNIDGTPLSPKDSMRNRCDAPLFEVAMVSYPEESLSSVPRLPSFSTNSFYGSGGIVPNSSFASSTRRTPRPMMPIRSQEDVD